MKRTFVVVLLSLFMVTSFGGPVASAAEHFGPDFEPGGNTGYDGPPVEVTFYHHLYNLLDTAPMNTQPMDSAAPDISQGRTMPTLMTPQGEAPASNDNNIFLYSSPGPVHYNESIEEPRVHPERGLGYDLLLSGDEPTVYWYMSADALEVLAESPQQIGVMPNVEVTATLRLGDDIAGDLSEGEVISQGTTTVDLMSGPEGTPMGMVHEIEIPMEPPSSNIPAEESFSLEVSWTQLDQGGVTFTDRQWKLHTGEQFPNRMDLTIENPIRMNYVHPQIIGERQIAVHTAFVTPLGNYDVDLNNLTMEVTDSDGETVIRHEDGELTQGQNVRGPVIVQKDYGHHAHHEPVLVTWVWDYEAANADPGDYVVEASASNLQNSATAAKSAGFTLSETGEATAVSSEGHEQIGPNEEEENESPLGAGLVLATLLGTVAIAQRRMRR